MEAVSFVDFSFTYPMNENATLCHVDFEIGSGSFLTLCGPTGSGKTTLLRCIKHELTPVGVCEGSVFVLNRFAGDVDPRESAAHVGFVMQDPENQLVMDTVWHELAFGLENLGLPTDVIHRRVAETAHFFGIGDWFEKRTDELSGGQKQILNLAAIMAMQPAILVLDEPTAQLDPVAAKEFLQVLCRVNRELGTTVILSEHRLEDVLPISDTVVFIEKGSLSHIGTPQQFVSFLYSSANPFAKALPAPAQVANLAEEQWGESASGLDSMYPLDVREGREWLLRHSPSRREDAPNFERYVINSNDLCSHPATTSVLTGETLASAGDKPVLAAKDIWFRYGFNLDYILRGVSIELHSGEIHALVGGNGSGKSTLLRVLSEIRRPERGTIKCAKGRRIAHLAQDPKTLFLHDTLKEDLVVDCGRFGYSDADVQSLSQRLGLNSLMTQHPYDLSGGELQKAALAKLLLLSPDALLLDEPTKGIDAFAKYELAAILREQRDEGRAILIVSHDLDFCAEVADTCSMLFNGGIAARDSGKAFFAGNMFYTTGVNRVMRGFADECVTLDDVSNLLRATHHG